jgi:F420-dependent oxidoreductase-like protein
VRLGLQLGYDDPTFWVGLAEEADRLGFDSVWTSEAYGSDAVSPLAWIGGRTEHVKLGTAIMQMPARSPATTAATIATLDLLSGGRTLLGLGTSGPQVAEGWHGQAWGKPLTRTREYVEIVRTILRREEPLEHHGEHYDIPYTGAGATGLGKPLKLIVHPPRPDVPIYLAAIGPKNVALAAEIADGWLPIFFSPERFSETHLPMLEEGFARRGGRPAEWDLAAHVPVVVTDDADVQVARDVLKPLLALYVGGMGAKGQNFYTRLAERYGFEEAAATVQDLYLAGKKTEAIAAVPDALVDEVALVGGRDRIADRLAAFRDCGVTTLVLQARQPEALRLLAELVA